MAYGNGNPENTATMYGPLFQMKRKLSDIKS